MLNITGSLFPWLIITALVLRVLTLIFSCLYHKSVRGPREKPAVKAHGLKAAHSFQLIILKLSDKVVTGRVLKTCHCAMNITLGMPSFWLLQIKAATVFLPSWFVAAPLSSSLEQHSTHLLEENAGHCCPLTMHLFWQQVLSESPAYVGFRKHICVKLLGGNNVTSYSSSIQFCAYHWAKQCLSYIITRIGRSEVVVWWNESTLCSACSFCLTKVEVPSVLHMGYGMSFFFSIFLKKHFVDLSSCSCAVALLFIWGCLASIYLQQCSWYMPNLFLCFCVWSHCNSTKNLQ